MQSLPHLPALRWGTPYTSVECIELRNAAGTSAIARISQVNAGIIRRDLKKAPDSRASIKKLSVSELTNISKKAAELFFTGKLAWDGCPEGQSPQDYVKAVSAIGGMPHALVWKNMARIRDAMQQMDMVLHGLTRGLEPSILDRGMGLQDGTWLSFYPVTDCLGIVMPSNSPGVNSLWLPSIPLKIPVMIKPGREEPLTSFRLIQAFIAAGCPPSAFGFYPTDHEGAGEILRGCGRSLLFGDTATTQAYASNPAVQIHGPGYSKILIGKDEIERWPEFIELIGQSISYNGGRSCINASAVVVPSHGKEIARAVAQWLSRLTPRPPDDPEAQLSGFGNPKIADAIDAIIEENLKVPGATDVTAEFRKGPRKVIIDGVVFLQPTVVYCDSFEHPLAQKEFLFPYASVVEIPQEQMLSKIGHSLVVTAITRDQAFMEQLLGSPLIQRLNLGPIPTHKVSWNQPHEGNLFDFMYKRRALEVNDNCQ